MIIGDNRAAVIENIRRSAESGDFFAKVETNDPVLTTEESNKIIQEYLKNRNTASFRLKTCAARQVANFLTFALNRNTEIVGLEKAKNVRAEQLLQAIISAPSRTRAYDLSHGGWEENA